VATLDPRLQRKLKHPERAVIHTVDDLRLEGKSYEVEISTLKGRIIIALKEVIANKTFAKEFSISECLIQ